LLPPIGRDDDAFLGPSYESTELKYRKRVVAGSSNYVRMLNMATSMIYLATSLTILFMFTLGHVGIYRFDIYYNFPKVSTDGMIVPRDFKVFWRLPLNYIAFSYLALPAIKHFLVAFPLRERYENLLSKNMSSFNYLEGAVSFSLLKVHLAVLSGIGNFHLLLSIFALSFSFFTCIFLFEYINGSRRNKGISVDWVASVLGTLPYLICWGIILSYFLYGAFNEGKPPLTWAAVCVSLCMELLLSLNFVLQWKVYRDFLKGEVVFVFLSLIYRQLVAWIAFNARSELMFIRVE